jgi:putative RNA 2'-phosphotransferase
MKNKNDNITTVRSKFLSLVLRHSPQTIGLKLDEAGWAQTQELLSCLARSRRSMSLSDLQAVVAADNKQRFAFSEDGSRIRANQGHSIAVELALTPRLPPAELYHGTATRFLDAIFQQGLTRQNRHHVHLSVNVEVAGTVGRRHGKLALLRVDAARMAADGHVFYCSDNGVWLVDAVPVGYLAKITT